MGISSVIIGTSGKHTDESKAYLCMVSRLLNNTDEDSVKDALSQLRNASLLMVSILTTGADPFTDKIRLIQLAVPGRPVVTIDPGNVATKTTELLREVLKRPGTKVFYNAKLQLKFLQRAGLPVNGSLFDTLSAHQLLIAGMASSGETLVDLARDYLGGRIAGNQLKNSALDIPVIKRLAKGLISDLKEAGLTGTAKLEFECIPSVVEMELNGMLLDLDKWQALSSKLQEEELAWSFLFSRYSER